MSKILLTSLFSELSQLQNAALEAGNYFDTLAQDVLTYRHAPDSWNVLECLEHLNLYAQYYLPLIEKKIKGQKNSQKQNYSPSWLGQYFAMAMKKDPRKVGENGVVNPKKNGAMKTFKNKNALNRPLGQQTIKTFIEDQKKLGVLLKACQHVDLDKVRIPITISFLIRLKLGDTLRFFVYHIERHVRQAQRAAQNGLGA